MTAVYLTERKQEDKDDDPHFNKKRKEKKVL